MQICRVRGSQKKVDKLVRSIEADERKAQATAQRPGKVTLPADIPGEIIATRPETFAPHIGWHRAVCVDVCDLGMVETKFGPRQQVEFAWELEGERREDGRRQVVWRKFNPSLADNSNLRKFLEVWQGYPFAAHELKAGVPLASRYYQKDGLILLEPYTSAEGKTYRNVVAAYPLPAKAPRVVSEGAYIRKVWRKRKAAKEDLADGTGVQHDDPEGLGGDQGGGTVGDDRRGDCGGDPVGGEHGQAEAIGTLPAGTDRGGAVHENHAARPTRVRVVVGEQ